MLHGWDSGVSGEDAKVDEFGTWRGSSVGIVGTWNDGTSESQTTLSTITDNSAYANWNGDLDIAVGGTVLNSGESYAEAANGAYAERWKAMASALSNSRDNKAGTTFVRPFHEFNGDWYKAWQVTPENIKDYQKSFRDIAIIIRSSCKKCKIVWSPNNGTSNGSASPIDAYPGDQYVDVIGVDSYNANGATRVTSPGKWETYKDATNGSIPVGPEAWRTFAKAHNKPISFPEWGLNPGGNGSEAGGDDPEYIKEFNSWMAQNAAKPGDQNLSGKVLYDIYFNISQGSKNEFLIKDGPNKNAGKEYTSLKWGNSSSSSAGVNPTTSTSTSTVPTVTNGQLPIAPAVTAPTSSSDPTSQPSSSPTQPVINPLIPQVAPTTSLVSAQEATTQGVTADNQDLMNLTYVTAQGANTSGQQSDNGAGDASGASKSGNSTQLLDLHLPKRTGSAVPLIIAIHGGAFNGGSKTEVDNYVPIDSLVSQGYAVASLDYRLAGDKQFPTGVQDVKAAVRWLRANASKYGIDPNRFAAWGDSAGGYMALALGATGDQSTLFDDPSLGNPNVSSAVQAVVSYYGPTDFKTMDTQVAEAGCGKDQQSHNGPASASPESKWLGENVPVSSLADDSVLETKVAKAKTLPPFLLVHGTADCTVPPGQSKEMDDAIKQAHGESTLITVSGAGHEAGAINNDQASNTIAFIKKAFASVPVAKAPVVAPPLVTTAQPTAPLAATTPLVPSATPTTQAASAAPDETPTTKPSTSDKPQRVHSSGS